PDDVEGDFAGIDAEVAAKDQPERAVSHDVASRKMIGSEPFRLPPLLGVEELAKPKREARRCVQRQHVNLEHLPALMSAMRQPALRSAARVARSRARTTPRETRESAAA